MKEPIKKSIDELQIELTHLDKKRNKICAELKERQAEEVEAQQLKLTNEANMRKAELDNVLERANEIVRDYLRDYKTITLDKSFYYLRYLFGARMFW